MKKIAIVDIKGGFGNQIFQFAFANNIKKLGYKVYINNRFYEYENQNTKNNTHRELILKEENYDFENVSNPLLLLFKLLIKLSSSNKTKWLFKIFDKFFIKLGDHNFKATELKYNFIYFDGYWQNIEYLNDNLDFIKKSLSNNELLKNAFANKNSSNDLLMIVRRGDYIDMKEDLNLKFYMDALNYFKKHNIEINLNIFTDDIEWVKSKKEFINAKNLFGPEDSPDGVINLFAKMLQNEHFIISNSTFALVAAVLSEKNSSHILTAHPWFRNSINNNLSKKNWIKIPNNK